SIRFFAALRMTRELSSFQIEERLSDVDLLSLKVRENYRVVRKLFLNNFAKEEGYLLFVYDNVN
ncbi:MAG: hypothetical protein JW908_01485, partial [Anaerolineales bacterium]|nr:hypothetical protein [Anaerolineales bacterium]